MAERVGFIGLGIMGRGMANNLIKAGFKVRVWNRTASRAEELTAVLGGTALKPDPTNANVPEADVLVNCTAFELDDSSSGLTGIPVSVDQLARYATVVDLAYKPGGTVLTAEAAKRTTVVDGLEILVQQGARSFELWTGRPADVEAMRTAIRNKEDHGAAYDSPGRRSVT